MGYLINEVDETLSNDRLFYANKIGNCEKEHRINYLLRLYLFLSVFKQSGHRENTISVAFYPVVTNLHNRVRDNN